MLIDVLLPRLTDNDIPGFEHDDARHVAFDDLVWLYKDSRLTATLYQEAVVLVVNKK